MCIRDSDRSVGVVLGCVADVPVEDVAALFGAHDRLLGLPAFGDVRRDERPARTCLVLSCRLCHVDAVAAPLVGAAGHDQHDHDHDGNTDDEREDQVVHRLALLVEAALLGLAMRGFGGGFGPAELCDDDRWFLLLRHA